MRDRTSPGARAALVGLGVLALLAVVALASRGGLGGGGSHGAGPSQGILDWAFSVFLVAYVLTIPFVVWTYFVQRGREIQRVGRRTGGGRWLQNIVVFLGFLAIAIAIVRLRESHAHGLRFRVPGSGGGRPASPDAQAVQSAPSFEWPVVAIAAALGVAALVAYLLARTRKGAPRERRAVSALGLALDDAIDDVLGETDPRHAVIKAYGRMEAVLAAHGLPRRPPEAPYEYLARALQELDASAASIGRLTELFERAKFSRHEIDGTMRADAIVALTAVRDELRDPA